MAVDQAQVGLIQPQSDGAPSNLRSTNDGALVMTENYGKYLEATRRKLTYVAITTTAVAINGIGSAATYPILYNPTNAGVLVIPLILNITPVYYGAAATAANYPSGGFCLATITNSVAGIVSTYLSTLTNNAPSPLVAGPRTFACNAQWSATAGVGTTGVAVRWFDIGLSGYAGVSASTPNALGFGAFSYDVQGAGIIAPGGAIALAQNATMGATTTFHISLLFAEIPMPAGF